MTIRRQRPLVSFSEFDAKLQRIECVQCGKYAGIIEYRKRVICGSCYTNWSNYDIELELERAKKRSLEKQNKLNKYV